jgi:EAL domain-containing protein (putative c-di-GMP-specific phosphodiesterase class I)
MAPMASASAWHCGLDPSQPDARPAPAGAAPQGQLAALAAALAALLCGHLALTAAGAWLALGLGLGLLALNLLIWWGSVQVPSAPGAALARPQGAEVSDALRSDLLARRLRLRFRAQRSLPDGPLNALLVQAVWRHPRDGPLDGEALATRARADGLDDALFDATLAQACEQFVIWRRSFPDSTPPVLAVDLPMAQATCGDLAARVTRILLAAGVDAAALQLHLPQAALAVVSPGPLVAAGTRLAASGFGAAGSSLGALQAWPLRAVVLDAGLVARLPGAGHERLVVEATVRLAELAQMTVVGDGVSTPEQALALAELGCHAALGDAMGPWLDAPDWSRRLASGGAAA